MEEQQHSNVSILDYLIVVLKRKRMILWATGGAAVLALVASLIMPKTYRAESRILPPQQQAASAATQLLSQLGSVSGATGFLGVKTPNDLYIGLMKSRTLLDRVIERFDLMKVYGKTYRQDARQKLLDAFKVQDDKKSGIISLGVEDRDPKRSADMTNAFVEELKNLTQYIAVSEASQRRLFFEEQLKSTKEALLRSEESLKGFQERTGAIEIREQTKAVIESVAQLRAQLAAKEVQLKVLRTYATDRNPDLQKVEAEYRGIREQLSKLESKSGDSGDALVSAGRIPETGTGYLRKIRGLKYNETLYDLLSKQYEMAKMDEARDAAVIQVLDSAVVPEKKVKPNRIVMVVIAAFTAFFFSVLAAFFLDYRERMLGDPESREKLNRLKQLSALDPVTAGLLRRVMERIAVRRQAR